jgi:hypothetical protein
MDVSFRQPRSGRVKQPGRYLLIVNRLEETEEPPSLIVALDVSLVYDRQHSPTRIASTVSQKGLTFVLLIERMSFEADEFLLVQPQRRNPIRIVSVDPPRQLEEVALLATRANRHDR